MSVQSQNPDQEAQLVELEAKAMEELASAQPTVEQPAPAKTEGETETPEPASTADNKTDPAKPEGVVETPPGDKPNGAPAPETPTKPTEDGTDNDQPSEKAENRYQKLAKDLKEANEKIKALTDTQTRAPKQVEKTKATGKLPWDDENAEITQDQFEENVNTRATEIVTKQRQVDATINQVTFDRIELESKYPELRSPEEGEENSEYDEKLVDFITTNYLIRLKENPTLRLKDYANEIMTLRASAAERASKKSAETMRTQANSQPVIGETRSISKSTVDDKIAGAKTIEELETLENSLPS